MIHDLAVSLQATLRAHKCPITVVEGPERTKPTTYANERVVVEEPEDKSTRTAAPRSQSINPKRVLTAADPVRVTVYAKSPVKGALDFEHVTRARAVVDLVLVGLKEFVSTNKLAWQLPEYRRIRPADLEQSERSPGAAYQIDLAIERSVTDRDWNGAAAPEATIGASTIKHTDLIGPPGADPETNTETACGGD